MLDDGAIQFIERKTGAYDSAGPLTDEQIGQIGEGNLQDTSASGLEATNCDAEQRAAARGMTGPCGNVMKVTVQPGNNLCTLARERYGAGTMYTQIFIANRGQIKNPDLIYPGQIFSMPEPGAETGPMPRVVE